MKVKVPSCDSSYIFREKDTLVELYYIDHEEKIAYYDTLDISGKITSDCFSHKLYKRITGGELDKLTPSDAAEIEDLFMFD